MAKNVPSSAAPGSTRDHQAAVHGHITQSPRPAASRTDDMRDGDSDSGASVPQEPQTTVPGSSATEAWRGNGTP